MSNLPAALGFGIVIGVSEELALWHGYTSGQVELGLFVAVFVLLAFTRRAGRERAQGSWLAVQAWPVPPPEIARLWSVRFAGKIGFLLLVLGLLALDLVSNKDASTLTTTLAYTLVGISVYITCGLVGQLSLGQFALAGIGAALSYQLTKHGVTFVVAVALAAVLTAPIAALIGFTSLRVRGLMLTVTTLAFAVVTQDWLLAKPWTFGDGVYPHVPTIFGHAPLDTFKRYYLFALVVFVVGSWLAWNVARGGLARILVAVRDNEDGARAFGISATTRKLQAFAIAGMLAGLGGALYAGSLFRVGSDAFAPDIGITVVAMSAIGGITLMMGSLVGALYLIALPGFVHFSAAETATSTVGWLLLVLYFPGGGGQLLRPVRDLLFNLLAKAHGVDARAARTTSTPTELRIQVPTILRDGVVPTPGKTAGDTTILSVEGMTKRFGGVVAVDDVSFELEQGSVLGLIGPNGAGKTTLFEMVSGFVRPDRGTTIYDGRNVSRLSPERRADIGLVSSFQDARLFPTITVLDVVRLAHERTNGTSMLPSLVGWRSALRRERENRKRAEEVIGFMGLERFRNVAVGELSTGTRRIVELTCLIVLRPRVLLLDEPSAGLAQRETEALEELLLLLRKNLEASIVVIEHDMPLISAVSDRVLAMHLGRRIAYGRPEEVIADPEVVASYLGEDASAIRRSGKAPVALSHAEEVSHS
jgi:ABC-type branched-subunit amino acid transport system ATPase component/ABC-type branched-subunit amino acid transport system permease subunit